MFTGIVEEIGFVSSVRPRGGGAVVGVRAPRVLAGSVVGDSIAVNGVCLTLTEIENGEGRFDAAAETLRRTTIGALKRGDRLNLERALAFGGRLGGHLVQGHVDATGTLRRIRPAGESQVMEYGAPSELRPLIVHKGSVAVDGVSLTVSALTSEGFEVSVIPYTLASTTLSGITVGSAVNIETDVIGKYVAHLAGQSGRSEITLGSLAEAGYLDMEDTSQ